MNTRAILTLALCGLLMTPVIANGYSYSGNKWSAGNCHWWQGNGMPWFGAWTWRLVEAAGTWNDAGAEFDFIFRGMINLSKAKDGFNVVCRYDRGNNGAIATTFTWLNSDQTIKECDMVLNSYYSYSTSGASWGYDLRSVATHEFGHFLRLLDLYGSADTEKTMYGRISKGETKKQTLHSDDINGIRAVYGSSAAPPLTADQSEWTRLSVGRDPGADLQAETVNFTCGPNPLSGQGVVSFVLGRSGHCKIDVYNIQGRCVRTLLNEDRNAGAHQIAFDGRGDSGGKLPQGIYLCRLSVGDKIHNQKLVITE